MADPLTLDPRQGGDFISATLHCMLYEGLTRCGEDGSLELALAQEVEISPDGKTYLFHLRPTTWNDGSPVTAFDFERSWKSILDPRFPSLCSYLLSPIQEVEATSETTLQVELKRPTPHFLSLTAFPLLFPVSPLGISNGPFSTEKMIAGQEIVLKKNPHYWNCEAVSLEKIHISILPHEMTAWQLFERGELDWLGGSISPIPPDILENVRSDLHFHPIAATTFCTFNTQTFPFQNSSLRKAFSYAIHREELAQRGQIPAQQCLPPSLAKGLKQNLTDVPLARKAFAQALEELGIQAKDLDGIVLYFKGGQTDKRLAQMLQKQWKEVLGVTVVLQELDFKSHMDRLHTRSYQLSIASWIAQFHDPINLAERFSSLENRKNFPAWDSPEYQKCIESIKNALDEKSRDESIARAEQLLSEEMPIAPLYHWSNPSLSNPHLEGLITTPCGGILFDRCKKTINIP